MLSCRKAGTSLANVVRAQQFHTDLAGFDAWLGRWRALSPDADAAAIKAMLAHPWSGNVRELEHAVERAVLMSAATQITRAGRPNTFRN